MWIVFAFWFLAVLDATMEQNQHRCPPLCPPYKGTVSCSLAKKITNCGSDSPSKTIAKFQCSEFYKLEGERILHCLSNNSWSSDPPQCKSDCGRGNPGISLIVNGVISTPGVFPWHVAIYYLYDNIYEFWCGGSLISEYAVLTAAHCTWNMDPEKMILVFGKFYREFDSLEDNIQKRKGKIIKRLDSYQDVAGNYNGDLAVVFLEAPVELNDLVKPICLDWNQEFVDEHLSEGSLGMVLGWGLTENDTFSNSLRILKLPVTTDEKCIAKQHRDFKKYITYTSFCAGYLNGTGVCNGDSGGGLAFLDDKTDRWYLQGLVSVSPRRQGTPFCDPHYYSVFTKVSVFINWLKKMKKIEEMMYSFRDNRNCWEEEKIKENKNTTKTNISKIIIKGWNVELNQGIYNFIKKYYQIPDLEVKGKKYIFPHSQKILQSAGIIQNTTDTKYLN